MNIGTLTKGNVFWCVGENDITNVHEIIEHILMNATNEVASENSVRVVYSMSNLEFDGTNTQCLTLTAEDLVQLKMTLDEDRPFGDH